MSHTLSHTYGFCLLNVLSLWSSSRTPRKSTCHIEWRNLIYFYLPFFFPLFFISSHILFPCSGSFSLFFDSWLSNKSFSPAEEAWSTLTWSLWPRNILSFLLHMVGSLTELLHVSPAPVRSALIFWAHSCAHCRNLTVRMHAPVVLFIKQKLFYWSISLEGLHHRECWILTWFRHIKQ